ncbi:MAG: DUF882 domain-containing protein [Pseudomonadota bacterium]
MTDTQNAERSPARRRFLIGAACALAAPVASPAIARGLGDYRRLKLTNWRTAESIDCVYWIDGQYVDEALPAFDHILRDWRLDRATRMDIRLINILASVQKRLECAEAFEIVSGYRTPETNAALRRRSRGVARNSYHTRAMAADVAMKTRSVRQMARAGLTLAAGGVGIYSRSEFVHLDSGPVRDWGR